MLMSKASAERVVQGYQMVARVRSNSYSGKDCDVHTYTGKHGTGYTVTSKKVTEYYVYPYTAVSQKVYNGGYDVSKAVETSSQLRAITYHGVSVKPTWMLVMDTVDGETKFVLTEDYTPITISGHRLTVCWTGAISEKTLRAKIRRKMREMINSGKAELYEDL